MMLHSGIELCTGRQLATMNGTLYFTVHETVVSAISRLESVLPEINNLSLSCSGSRYARRYVRMHSAVTLCRSKQHCKRDDSLRQAPKVRNTGASLYQIADMVGTLRNPALRNPAPK